MINWANKSTNINPLVLDENQVTVVVKYIIYEIADYHYLWMLEKNSVFNVSMPYVMTNIGFLVCPFYVSCPKYYMYTGVYNRA